MNILGTKIIINTSIFNNTNKPNQKKSRTCKDLSVFNVYSI